MHYTYIYIIDIENTFLSHSYFHIFRGIGLKTHYHHFTSLDEHIHGKMSHFDAIFDKICCLPAYQQTLFCLQQCEVCQFFCYRFACSRHTRIDSFELILKIVWSVELFPLAQLHFLLMVFFFSEKYNICKQFSSNTQL